MTNPSSSLSIDLVCRNTVKGIPAEKDIYHWANTAYRGNTRAEVAIVVVDSEEIRALNHSYRNKNQATNVLSFSADLEPIDGVTHLGDLILCAGVIEDEAKSQKKSLTSHWAHMTIHGMLHLQNYDHVETTDAELMEQTEIALLASLGFSNPYLATD